MTTLDIISEVTWPPTDLWSDEPPNDLQKTVLLGTIQGKSYLEIASEAQYTEKYIKDNGGKLWKILSESVEEKVKKSNVKATIERCYYSSNNIFQGI